MGDGMKARHRSRAKGARAAVTILAVGLSAALTAQGAQSLRLGILPDLDSVPLVIASMRGFYAAEGLEAAIERFPSAQNRDAALQAGKIDLAVSDLLAACFLAEGGFGSKAIMATQGAYRLVAAPGSPATSLSALRGRTVAISKNTIIEYCLERMLASADMRTEEVKAVYIPQMPLRLEMLRAGKVDAAVLPEPLASTAILDGSRAVDSSERLGVNPGVIIASASALAAKAPAIAAFARAYDRAAAYLSSAPRSDYIDALMKEAGFPEAIRDSLVLPAYHPAAGPSVKEAEAVAAWLLARGLVKRRYAPEELIQPMDITGR
jgi:NitT/TauT family transport system substrate-binding protein